MPWRTLDGSPPLILAHRGASGPRPEHTLEGYQLALDQGADVIEPDLVPSADGVMFARHDPGMARSTDIAARAEFQARQHEGDWRSDSLTAKEIDTLRAIQPFPGRSQAFDGKFSVPRWQAVLDWAATAARERKGKVILYPELKSPADFIARGVDPVRSFIDSVTNLPAGVEVWVQCFEFEPLRRVHEATGLHCCLGIDVKDDWLAAIREHGAWLSSLGVNKKLLQAPSGGDPARLVDAAHAAELRVDGWTYRDDRVGAGFEKVEDELRDALVSGIDGLFCDFPATGLAARRQIA
jgi:glycerophosphoryl diester phosphodiesterase